MRSYGIVINHIQQRKRIKLWLVLSTVGFLSLTLFSCYRYQSFRESQPTWRLWVVYLSYDMQQGILTALVSNYIFSIFILSDRFEKLNTSLEWANIRHSLFHIYHIPGILGLNISGRYAHPVLFKCVERRANTCTNTDENTNTFSILSTAPMSFPTKRGTSVAISSPSQKSTAKQKAIESIGFIKRIGRLHDQLCSIMDDINFCYSCQVMCAQRISGCYSWFESDQAYSLYAPTRLWWYWPLISYPLC